MNPTQKETLMPFQAYDVSLELIRTLRESLVKIAQHDRNLADQIRRAATSVPLNLREGRARVGRDRLHLWRVAAGSAEELVAAAEVAQAFGYVDDGELADTVALANRVLAMCWRLTHP
jgi:four helix bundle protein